MQEAELLTLLSLITEDPTLMLLDATTWVGSVATVLCMENLPFVFNTLEKCCSGKITLKKEALLMMVKVLPLQISEVLHTNIIVYISVIFRNGLRNGLHKK